MRERDHALAPRLRPAHGPSEAAREPADEQLLGAERLAPKPPPTSGAITRSCAGLEAERAGEAQLVLVRRLRREPGGQAAVLADLGGGRARLERARRHALADERVRDDDVAAVEERLVVLRAAARRGDVRADVREEQHLVLRRLVRVDDGRQRVVVDHHELGGVGARRAVLADDDRDDVADEANDVLRDERAAHRRLDARERRRPERRARRRRRP